MLIVTFGVNLYFLVKFHKIPLILVKDYIYIIIRKVISIMRYHYYSINKLCFQFRSFDKRPD